MACKPLDAARAQEYNLQMRFVVTEIGSQPLDAATEQVDVSINDAPTFQFSILVNGEVFPFPQAEDDWPLELGEVLCPRRCNRDIGNYNWPHCRNLS